MAGDDRLRLEYDRAVALFAELTEIRFKLLALVPTLSGAAVALLHAGEAPVELIAVGLLGLAATLGVLVYELRNSEIRRAAGARIGAVESEVIGRPLIENRAKGAARLLGVIPLQQSIGLALVYGAALAGWGYLVSWGVLAAAHAGHSRQIGVVIGAAFGVLAVFEVLRLDRGE
ncbi:MAG TPA: hypothetical protein VI142_08485 [Gaiellaceae bacterium]